MARILSSLLLGLFAGGGSLLLGLTGSALRTGRLDPLDWLLPGLAALIILSLVERRNAADGRLPVAANWLLVALPPALLVLLAASRAPWSGLAAVGAALALAAVLLGGIRKWSARRRWPLLLLLCLVFVAGRWIMQPHTIVHSRAASLPSVGVVSALPLYGPTLTAAEQDDPLRGAGRMSPLWQALAPSYDLQPIDHLDAAALAPHKRLLIAQPRQLAPEELVALDAWVRAGGQVLILADPLLHWPDPRPLGHKLRAPLTSLLDPLLLHWGIRLEPDQYAVEGDPVVRRVLGDGGLLQIAGASRFSLYGKGAAACRLAEDGLIARCTVGKGAARLVADADWINDTLWTLDPIMPHDRAVWISDAIPTLTAWLADDGAQPDSSAAWLIDRNRLIFSLRWALFAVLLLAFVRARLIALPTLSRWDSDTGVDQNKNIGGLKADSG